MGKEREVHCCYDNSNNKPSHLPLAQQVANLFRSGSYSFQHVTFPYKPLSAAGARKLASSASGPDVEVLTASTMCASVTVFTRCVALSGSMAATVTARRLDAPAQRLTLRVVLRCGNRRVEDVVEESARAEQAILFTLIVLVYEPRHCQFTPCSRLDNKRSNDLGSAVNKFI